MYKTKLCMGTSVNFGISIEEQITLFKQTGFDAFFTDWDENIKNYRKLADKIGMTYQSLHAPFTNSAKMWKKDEESESAVNELLQCVKDCSEANIPIMVAHVYIGFESNAGPNEAGIENFGRVIEEAAKRNVKIAFENTEGEEYLAALMKTFSKYKNVGFCWDTGHELCYNKGKDMMALYGEHIICTHLNDNLGISDFNGKITWTDDLHLLPFDGINDWNSIVMRLNKYDYNDILTFELVKSSKPGRHDNDKYNRMIFEEYVAEAYARACRVATLKRKVQRVDDE